MVRNRESTVAERHDTSTTGRSGGQRRVWPGEIPWVHAEACIDRRTTGKSSVGVKTITGSSGTVTHVHVEFEATVVTHLVMHLHCWLTWWRCLVGHSGDRGVHWGAEMGRNLPAVDLGPGRSAVAVSAGYHYTCAVLVSCGVDGLATSGKREIPETYHLRGGISKDRSAAAIALTRHEAINNHGTSGGLEKRPQIRPVHVEACC